MTDYIADPRCKTGYLLQETSGNALDTSAASNDGLLGAGGAAPTWAANGCAAFSDKSISFDGGDTLTPENNVNTYIDLTQGTIMCWYKANTAASGDILFSFEGGGSLIQLYFVTSTSMSFIHRYNYGTYRQVAITVDSISSDTDWHFVSIRWNDAGNIDGEATRTLSISYDGTYVHDTDNLDVGAISGSGIIGSSFTGQIDEMAFFNDVLTTAELADIRANGLSPSAPPAAAQPVESDSTMIFFS